MENKATEGKPRRKVSKPRRKGSIEQEESAPESSKPGEGEVPTNEENKEEDTSCCSLRWQKKIRKDGKKEKKFYCGLKLCCFPCCGKEED